MSVHVDSNRYDRCYNRDKKLAHNDKTKTHTGTPVLSYILVFGFEYNKNPSVFYCNWPAREQNKTYKPDSRLIAAIIIH